MLGDDTKVLDVSCASVTRKNAKPFFDGNSRVASHQVGLRAQVEVLNLPAPNIVSYTTKQNLMNDIIFIVVSILAVGILALFSWSLSKL